MESIQQYNSTRALQNKHQAHLRCWQNHANFLATLKHSVQRLNTNLSANSSNFMLMRMRVHLVLSYSPRWMSDYKNCSYKKNSTLKMNIGVTQPIRQVGFVQWNLQHNNADSIFCCWKAFIYFSFLQNFAEFEPPQN